MKLDPKSPAFVIMLGAQSTLPPLSIDSSLPALPMIGENLQAAPAAVQWTLSGFLVGFAIGQIVWGQAGDRFGRRPVLIAGFCLYILAGLGCVFAPTISMLVLMRLLQGFSACAGVVIGRAMIRDCFEGRVAIAKQALLGLLPPLAMLVAPIVGGAIVSLFDWRVNFAILPATGSALAIAIFLWLPETKRAAPHAVRTPFLTAAAIFFRQPRAFGFASLNALAFGALFCYISGSPAVLIDHFGIGPARFGQLFAIAALALVVGALCANLSLRYFSAKLSRRIGLTLLAGALLALIGLAQTDHLPVVLLAAAALAIAVGMLMPHAIAGAMAPLPQIAGTASGLLGAMQFIAGALSGSLIGLYHPGTVAGMFISMSLFAGCALAIGLILETFLREPRSW